MTWFEWMRAPAVWFSQIHLFSSIVISIITERISYSRGSIKSTGFTSQNYYYDAYIRLLGNAICAEHSSLASVRFLQYIGLTFSCTVQSNRSSWHKATPTHKAEQLPRNCTALPLSKHAQQRLRLISRTLTSKPRRFLRKRIRRYHCYILVTQQWANVILFRADLEPKQVFDTDSKMHLSGFHFKPSSYFETLLRNATCIVLTTRIRCYLFISTAVYVTELCNALSTSNV